MIIRFFFFVFMSCAYPISSVAAELVMVSFIDKPTDVVGSDWSDLPLNPCYVEALRENGFSIRYQLRWFNAVSLTCNQQQLGELHNLSFVKSVISLHHGIQPNQHSKSNRRQTSDSEIATLLPIQRYMLNLDSLLQRNISGKGVCIAILDAGFKEANTHPALRHLFENKQILAAKDFYSARDNVFYHSYHGTAVLSCIAGKFTNGVNLGAAPDATFLLARTEHNFIEKPIEEDHWFAAMEWAVDNGARIISSSLGYSGKRHPYEKMDGYSSLVAQAANIAFSKGVLIVNAAGNEGAEKFHYINTPADADSVLTVGGVYPNVRHHIRFSSFGPNSRGVMKPDVCAPGYVVCAWKKGKYNSLSGTSFATPLISGLAACLLQKHPDWSAAKLYEEIRKSGHLYPYFDYAQGFGVPDAMYFLDLDLKKLDPSLQVIARNDTAIVMFSKEGLLRDSSINRNGVPLLFHYFKNDGRLESYQYQLVTQTAKAVMITPVSTAHAKLRIWFDGWIWEADKGVFKAQ